METTVVKILGKEYKLRTDSPPEHLEAVAQYVDGILSDVRRSVGDSQDAAVLTALNIASDLLRVRELPDAPNERIRGLIELVDSV